MSEEQTTAAEEKFQRTALALRQQVAPLLPIKSDDDFQAVGSLFKTAQANVKAINDHLAGPIQDAHAKHKKLTALRTRILKPFNDIAGDARHAIGSYSAQKQRERAEAQRVAEEAARKAQEEVKLAQAEQAEAEGNKDVADAILEAPTAAVTVNVVEAPKIDGVHTREKWDVEVFDLKALFAAYGTGVTTIPALDDKDMDKLISILKLNKLVTALKSNFNVPGCRAKKSTTVAGRSQ